MPKYALSCVETCSARTEYYSIEADSLEEALLLVASGDATVDERRNCEIDHWDYLLDAQEDEEPISAERQKAADDYVRGQLSSKTAERPAQTESISQRELATVLAALRCFQQEVSPLPLSTIKTYFAKCDPLTIEEIDALCERLNCKTVQPAFSTAASASLAELIEICRWKCSPHDDVILANGRTNHQACWTP